MNFTIFDRFFANFNEFLVIFSDLSCILAIFEQILAIFSEFEWIWASGPPKIKKTYKNQWKIGIFINPPGLGQAQPEAIPPPDPLPITF